MEEDEAKILYEKLLENFTLYNQYKNNVPFADAYKISKMLLRINNLAIENGLYMGDVDGPLNDFVIKLESEERNRDMLFV